MHERVLKTQSIILAYESPQSMVWSIFIPSLIWEIVPHAAVANLENKTASKTRSCGIVIVKNIFSRPMGVRVRGRGGGATALPNSDKTVANACHRYLEDDGCVASIKLLDI